MDKEFKFNVGDKLYAYKCDNEGLITKTELTVTENSDSTIDFEHPLESGEMSSGYFYDTTLDSMLDDGCCFIYASLTNMTNEFFKSILIKYLMEKQIKIQKKATIEIDKLMGLVEKLEVK